MSVVEEVLKFRHWEQGKKVNFGKLFGYISTMRERQKALNCGKVFPASYLATFSRHKDKNYILVIDMIKQRDSVYANKPLVYAKIIVGTYQVIVKIFDMNSMGKLLAEIVFESSSKVMKIVSGLLELFESFGIVPVKTADIYFGSVMPEFQTTFDSTFELLSDEELMELYEHIKDYGYIIENVCCVKRFGDFNITISHKNIYNDFIVTLVDNNDQSNIHWAIKTENLSVFMEQIQQAFDRWNTDRFNVR